MAHLMRSAPHNPVVAECAITHERNVASTLIPCRHFKQRVGEAEIHTVNYPQTKDLWVVYYD